MNHALLPHSVNPLAVPSGTPPSRNELQHYIRELSLSVDFGEAEDQPAPRLCVRLGADLRRLRVSADLTQRQLAKAINYSHVMIHRVETGQWPFSQEVVMAIATALAAPETKDLWRQRWAEVWAEERGGRRFRRMVRRRLNALLTNHVKPNDVARIRLYEPTEADAESVETFQRALRNLRESGGTPSFERIRALAAARGYFPSTRSALHALLQPGRTVLREEIVQAFVVGCGVRIRDFDTWMGIFRLLPAYVPPVRAPRQVETKSPPPVIDLTEVSSVVELIEAVKRLMAASGRSMDKVIAQARQHPGRRVPVRSALHARFRRGLLHGEPLPRDLFVAVVRGCYCRTVPGHRCVADCSADLIVPWERAYDRSTVSVAIA
ncbi:helix-turn-helix domain-containing protein [Nocardia sp. NPDC127526]|uniref:helix-turn-helix domain-containing protein n=1 Tax=Nocardia sp. NPDC127526 TaxID=3345393 RepID=UPI00362C047D